VGRRQGAVENLVIDPGLWRGRRVFLTGHTGFKGGWTSLALSALGARVFGFALAPVHDHGIFPAAGIERDVDHRLGDIRDFSSLAVAMAEARPEIVIHMAAQALVRLSYEQPLETYATNLIGTVNLLEAVRHTPSVRAVIVVTSDKCYAETGDTRSHRETDRLGGDDPYSSSKACAEIATAAYSASFFRAEGAAAVATVRAGNVIGGGDWAPDRLVPDAMRAFGAGREVLIRNPGAIRPWQHVLDPVIGYLALAQRLVTDGRTFAGGWNFGPGAAGELSVAELMDRLVAAWGTGAGWRLDEAHHPPEAAVLKLDCTRAAARLGWRPLLGLDRAISLTTQWYRAVAAGTDIRALTLGQIDEVLGRATVRGLAAGDRQPGPSQAADLANA
jgi:CDP-glucose 4,6-dehydratase